LSESELEKAKSPTNSVLDDAPVRNNKEKEDRVSEEVYSVDEDTVEKTPISDGETTSKTHRLLYGDSGGAI